VRFFSQSTEMKYSSILHLIYVALLKQFDFKQLDDIDFLFI